jgi:hypothetical protein
MTNPKRELFEVWVSYPEAEQKAREAAEEMEREAAEVRRQIEALPKSAEAYRPRIISIVESFVVAAIDSASTPKYDGYRLHPETIAELARLAGDMVNAIETGEILFDRKARIAAEFKIRGKGDPLEDGAYLDFKGKMTPPGWTGDKELRAEADALYKP